MKKSLFLLTLLLIGVMAFAAKEDMYLLYANFENGKVPEGWTQENVVGEVNWVVESAATAENPTGANNGSSYRLAIRNTNQQTSHFVTRLISPVINLKEVYQPIVVFSHAQQQWTGDVDELRVYYRSSSESRWVMLEEYTEKITAWRNDTLTLTAATETYQLAFEMTDNLGRGVVLDDIIVRPSPTCTNPTNLVATEIGITSAKLQWAGSFDTDSFRVILAKEYSDDPSILSDKAIDTYVYDFGYNAEGLEQGPSYYAYVQAHCGNDLSDWTYIEFKTRNAIELPYNQTFDKEYVANTTSHVEFWTHGTNITSESGGNLIDVPFINQLTASGDLSKYSYNSTTSLVFTGAERSLNVSIPAGTYVYAATPEIIVDKIQDVELEFWGTASSYSNKVAAGLMVGVMTDPNDYSTFEVIDTVYAKKMYQNERYVIYFDKYKGTGKYIAFASNFVDKPNIFFMDNVTIRQKANIRIPQDIRINKIRATEFTIDADMNGESMSKLTVAIEKTDKNGILVLDPSQLEASDIIMTKEITSFPCTVQLPSGSDAKIYQVYVQNMKNGEVSRSAIPYKLHTPALFNGESFFTGFETTEACGSWNMLTAYNFYHGQSSSLTATLPNSVITSPNELQDWPSTVTLLSTTNKAKLLLRKQFILLNEKDTIFKQKYGDYVSFAEVENIKDVYLTFKLNLGNNESEAKVAVGVMTDPYDPSTFEAVSEFNCTKSTADGILCAANFETYTGNGHFPALMALDTKTSTSLVTGNVSERPYTTSYGQIDDVNIIKLGTCNPIVDLKANVLPTGIELNWGANRMNQWKVVIASNEAMTSIVKDETVSTPSFSINTLASHTKYWLTITPICSESAGETYSMDFTTICKEKEDVPYLENFDSYVVKIMSGQMLQLVHCLPSCWDINFTGTNLSASPAISEGIVAGNYAHSGTQQLWFEHKSDLTEAGYAALPKMNAPLNQVQLSMFIRANKVSFTNTKLVVGVMEDPTDLSTFDSVATINVGSIDFEEHIVSFKRYTGKGEHIAFRKNGVAGNSNIYIIDDVLVDYIPTCEKVQDVRTLEVNDTEAVIYWPAADYNNWEVLLTSEKITPTSAVTVDGTTVISCTQTSTSKYTQKNLTPNTTYYAYVRTVCSATDKGEWSAPTTFTTSCSPMSADEIGTIDFSYGSDLSCWKFGLISGEVEVPTTSAGYLYLHNDVASNGAYAIMPQLNVDSINRMQVRFSAHGGTKAGALRQLTVGVLSNPLDMSTFVAVAKIDLNTVIDVANFNEGNNFVVRFDNYKGDYNEDYGKYIAFVSESGDQENYIYIDNVTVDTIPSCLEPSDLKLKDLTHQSAKIEWENLGNKYQIQLFLSNEYLLKDSIIDKANIELTNLDVLTSYKMRARTICGTGDTSAWSPYAIFTTDCPPTYPLPYIENFDYKVISSAVPYTLPNCCYSWYAGNSGSEGSTYARIYSSAAKEGNGGFYMGSTYGSATTASKESYLVLPNLEGNVNQYLISFDHKSTSTTGNRKIKIGVAASNSSLSSVLTTVEWIDSVIFAGTDWKHYSAKLTSYTGTNKYIVIANVEGTGSGTTVGYIYLDNLYIESIPTCDRPEELKLTSAQAHSAIVSWKPNGNETTWEVAYGQEGIRIDDATKIIVTSPKAELPNLISDYSYDVYVRAICSETDASTWLGPLNFTTLCAITPNVAAYNFDDAANYVQPAASTSTNLEKCWMLGNKLASTNYTYIPYNNINTTSNFFNRSGTASLKFNTTASYNGAYAIMPEMVANFDTLQLTFWMRAVYFVKSARVQGYSLTYAYSGTTYQRGIKVGVASDPYDLSTFEEIADIQLNTVGTASGTVDIVDEEGTDFWRKQTVPLYNVKGKYIVFLSEYEKSNTVWIDDIAIETLSADCPPSQIKCDPTTLSTSSADISWATKSAKVQLTISDGTNTIVNTTIEGSTYHATNLQPNTTYVVSIRNQIGENQYSEWGKASFNTPCAPVEEEEAMWNFEDNLVVYGASNTSYKIPECWTVGTTVAGAAQSNAPYSIGNTGTYQYARGEGTTQRALQFYATTTYYDSYAIMPELNIDMDNSALHFFMRSGYNKVSGNVFYAANTSYDKKLVIGYVIGNDINTFVPMDTVTYPHSVTTTTNVTSREDAFWNEQTIVLADYAGENHRIALRYAQNKPAATTYLYVDDLSIIPAISCNPISTLRAANISANSANILWSMLGNDTINLQLAYDDSFSEVLLDTIVEKANGKFSLNDLIANTDYTVRIKHICSEEDESDWAYTYFLTDCRPLFAEHFNEVRTYPLHWTRKSGSVYDMLNNGYISDVDETSTYAWRRSPDKKDIFMSTGQSDNPLILPSYWLISPVINLQDISEKVMLSFDAYMVATNSSVANPLKELDQFGIYISLDEGKTWNANDAFIWDVKNNGNFDFNEITATPKCIYLDMTKYAGKRIVLAFNLSGSSIPSRNDLHLDNIQMNTYQVNADNVELCQWNDFSNEAFNLDANDLLIGDNNFESFVPATKDKQNDILNQLHINVKSATQTANTVSVCQGSDYTLDGFNIHNIQSSNVYKQKLAGCNACDSIVVLNINVLPIAHDTINATVCQGAFYEFAGTRYFTNTVVTNTFTSQLTGCDSIATLILNVNPILEGEANIHLCPGDVYHSETLGDITVAGDYIDSVRTALGCDSVAHLHIFTHDSVHTYIRAAICLGDKYSQGAFEGLANEGDYTLENKTIYGCDSLVTLHLLVADPEAMTIRDQIDANQLPYVLNGEELLPIGTADGAYTKTVMLPCGQATITIIVGQGSALENINSNSANIRKVVVDDKVFIIVNETWYDVLGNKVEAQK